MAIATSPPANGFVTFMRRIYNPLGFSKGYNFVLWFLTLGYLLGFSLARTTYLSFYGVFCNPNGKGGAGAAPGECYYYLRNPWRTGMQLHLYTIIPAAILVCFQFTPWVRHKVLLFHRMNGYLVILLSLVSDAGILIIAQVAFGGDFSTRAWSGMMVITTTICYIMVRAYPMDCLSSVDGSFS